MARAAVITLLIIIATLLIFEMFDGKAGAQSAGGFGQVLQNQKLILEKLNTMDKKLDQLKMRIRL